MNEEYDIFHNGCVTGKVQLKTEGLFYRLLCNCETDGNDAVCLWYADDKKEINLGVCACDGSSFIKRMNRRDLADGSFFIKSKQTVKEHKIYYIDDSIDPLVIMDNLPNLRLRKENGRVGFIIAPLA